MMDKVIRTIPEEWHVSHAYWNKEVAHFTLTRKLGEYVDGKATTPDEALLVATQKAKIYDNS